MAKSPVHIEVENLKEIQRRIRDLGDAELRKQLRAANKDVATMVVRAAGPLVPRRSGRLAQSLKPSATDTAAYGKAGTPARVPYAAAIHWGTGPRSGQRGPHNIKGRPFLWDAADRTLREAVQKYEQQIDDLIERVMR